MLKLHLEEQDQINLSDAVRVNMAKLRLRSRLLVPSAVPRTVGLLPLRGLHSDSPHPPLPHYISSLNTTTTSQGQMEG